MESPTDKNFIDTMKNISHNFFTKKRYRGTLVSVMIFSIILTGLFGVFVFSEPSVSDTEEMAKIEQEDNFLENLDLSPEDEVCELEAYGLYIDGAFIAALTDKGEIEDSLQLLIDAKLSSLPLPEAKQVQLLNEVSIKKGCYSVEHITDKAQLERFLGIEDRLSYTFEINSINGAYIDTDISLLVNCEVTEGVEIPYETQHLTSTYLDKGDIKKVMSGENGLGLAVFDAVYINDELVQKNYVDTEVIKEATPEVFEKGTRNPNKVIASLGILGLPYDGKISSPYGRRSMGYHYGLDIVAKNGNCYGDDIYAAEDGVVIFAGVNGGYGNNIKIDHGNGLVTLYAHLSSFSVRDGDVVKRGDVIGQIGTTGRVTGPHLHFEVIYKGEKMDPQLYVEIR